MPRRDSQRLSVQDVLDAFSHMTAAERGQFLRALPSHLTREQRDQLYRALVSDGDPQSLAHRIVTAHIGAYVELDRQRRAELTEQRRPYVKGPQAKRRRVEQRNQAIESFLAQGSGRDGDPTAAVYAFLMENHPDLLRKGRSHVSPESVMTAYWQSRNGAE
jgi:hypothetical protein